MSNIEWSQIQLPILQFEQEGLVTRTFWRLDSNQKQAVVHAIVDEASKKSPTAIAIQEVARGQMVQSIRSTSILAIEMVC